MRKHRTNDKTSGCPGGLWARVSAGRGRGAGSDSRAATHGIAASACGRHAVSRPSAEVVDASRVSTYDLCLLLLSTVAEDLRQDLL